MTSADLDILDDLKQRLRQHDQRLDEGLRLDRQLVHMALTGKAEAALSGLSRWLWIGLGVDVVLLLWLGSFIAAHVHEPRFVIPAAVLHVFLIVLGIGGSARQLVALRAVDWMAPVVQIQKRLEALRRERLQIERGLLVLAPLLWIPILIVGVKGLLGASVYDLVTPAWLLANVALGFIVLAGAVALSRRYAERMDRSPLVQRIMQDLVGSHLTAATRFTESLADLENPDRTTAK